MSGVGVFSRAIRYRAVGQLRARARTAIALTLLAAAIGGVAMAAEAAARRTDSAYPRFVRDHRASDLIKVGILALDPQADAFLDQVEALPQVAQATRGAYVFSMQLTSAGDIDRGPGIGQPLAPRRGWLETMDRPKLLEGRRPNPSEPNEMAISYLTARLTKLRVGSHLRLATWTPEQGPAVLAGEPLPGEGPTIDMTVVGVELAPGELAANSTDNTAAHFSAAFYDHYKDRVGFASGSYVRLRRGAKDVPAFVAGVRALDRSGGEISVADQAGLTAKTQRSIHLPAVALRLFAALLALAGLLIVGQAISRELQWQGADHEVLSALGMTRVQQTWTGSIAVLPIVVVGTVLAVALAAVLSPLSPVGLARVAEPHPGLAFDAPFLLLAAALMVAALGASSVFAAWRATRASRARGGSLDRPSALVRVVAPIGGSPSAVAGVRLGLESGRGRTAVPIRTTIAGVVLATAAVVTSFTFLDSLHRLLDTPRLYGWNWDIVVGNPYSSEDISGIVTPVLNRDPGVASFVGVGFGVMQLAGHEVEATAFDTTGSVGPAMIRGRAPARPDEVALGTKTLRRLHLRLGSAAPARVGGITSVLHVVGETALVNLNVQDNFGVGEGAALTFLGLQKLDPPRAIRKMFLVRLQPGYTVAGSVTRIGGAFPDGQIGALPARRPVDLDNFRRVERAPLAIAAVLAALGVATLTHALMSATKRRARDLAILKVLGFRRGQVRAAVSWQATVLAATAILIGLPLGVASGRWAWIVFARQLGVVAEPVVPLAAVLLVAPIAVVIANIAAAVPGHLAANTRPALVLRQE